MGTLIRTKIRTTHAPIAIIAEAGGGVVGVAQGQPSGQRRCDSAVNVPRPGQRRDERRCPGRGLGAGVQKVMGALRSFRFLVLTALNRVRINSEWFSAVRPETLVDASSPQCLSV